MSVAIAHPLTPPRSVSPTTSEPSDDVVFPLDSRKRLRIRSVLMRAGTSKGLFFRLEDLPADKERWGPVILAVMGSPDPSNRQLDGLGGGQSTQSKVAVVSPSESPDADVDYLFIQVPLDGSPLDFSGNCGNMLSGVGPFAVDEGMFKVKKASKHLCCIRVRNVNTNKIIRSSFEVEDGIPVELGQLRLDGVSVAGAPVRLDFLNPAGSMTGKLLPTGRALDKITLPPKGSLGTLRTFSVSCVDAANPFVFVSAEELGLSGIESIATLTQNITDTLMDIRAEAAVLMGLASSPESARLVMGTPKIAVVGPATTYTTTSGRVVEEEDMDIWIRPYSMGKPHPAIQMTGAVCVGSASSIPGTLISRYFLQSRAKRGLDSQGPVVIGHASGTMAVEGTSRAEADEVVVECGTVYRTARRLMEGSVLCYA